MKISLRWGAAVALLVSAIALIRPAKLRAQDAVETSRKAISKTPAVYPTLARTMNIHGVVKLEVVIEPNGTVKSVDIKGGHPLLSQAAVTAVYHWRFEPAAHQTKELVELKFDLE